jgi:predicted ATPase
MANDRITEICVKGLRTLADVTLKLDGLTVLIGDNGSGKSSLIEACELLRRATGENFLKEDFHGIHGGTTSLLRFGAPYLKLGLRLESDEAPLTYFFTITENGEIGTEFLHEGDGQNPPAIIERIRQSAKINGQTTEPTIKSQHLALSSFGQFPPHRAIARVLEALRSLDVQLPFDTTARWAQRSRGIQSFVRGATTIEPVEGLARFGSNLANAFYSLRNDFSETHWQETMHYVRLGLGYDVESITTRVDRGGGAIALTLKYTGLDTHVPAFSLSDGMLTYLCFVALYRLNKGKSLIAFDEPETHLHPELLMRVLGFFEDMARERPVLLVTHSDRLLDGLSDPARSVVLCDLDERRATRLVRPDPQTLAEWLTDYRGLGDVRSAGHAASVLTREDLTTDEGR